MKEADSIVRKKAGGKIRRERERIQRKVAKGKSLLRDNTAEASENTMTRPLADNWCSVLL